MDAAALRDHGIKTLDRAKNAQRDRWNYWKGEHELPYAPKGVNDEYEALRDMARVPMIRLAVRTPVQRLRLDGIRTGANGDVDTRAWAIWQANRLDSRQRIVYVHALVFGRGIVSVWPNEEDNDSPLVRVEDPRSVHVEPDPADPFSPLYAVKHYAVRSKSTFGVEFDKQVAFVYTPDTVTRFETNETGGAYEQVDEFDNPLGVVPFIVFAPEMDADGETSSMVDPLVPMQRAIDTVRFDLLLAAQFAAFRQRVVVGFDPVMRDDDGNVIVKKDANGEPLLDENGMQIPVTATPGRVGVDRLLVFPGADTEVFDIAESNLSNYVTALDMLVATFASTAQVPPQYLVGDFKNVNGDLMQATEATLLSLVDDLQTVFGEAWERVFSLASVARGGEPLPAIAECVWADASPKSLTVVANAMSLMVPHGAPVRMFLEMLPGATQQKVDRWMTLSADALSRALASDLAAMTAGPKMDGGTDVVDTAEPPVAG